MNTTTCTYCSNDGLPCSASSAKGYLCTREAGHDGRHAACDDEDHPIAAWNRRGLGAYERHETPDDMDGGVAAALVEKEAEQPTADDFAQAKFARDPGGDATAHRTPLGFWTSCTFHGIDDEAMARGGWVPVRECPDPDDHTLPGIARAVSAVTPCSCSAQRARAEKAEKERDEARRWLDETEALLDRAKADRDEGRAQSCPDKDAHWRLDEANAALEQMAKDFRVVQAQRDYAGKRARKAEKERDEAVYQRDQWMRGSDSWRTTLDEAIEERRRIARALGLPENVTADAMATRIEEVEREAQTVTDEMVRRAKAELEARAGGDYYPETLEAVLTAALTEPPARPEWIDAPAVRAWHKRDGRTERDGTPGKPRIWSPDYGTTNTWSTPSLRNVPWADLVDVEPLDVAEDGAA